MKTLLIGALTLALLNMPANAQPVTRVKARLIAINGAVMSVAPLPASVAKGAAPEPAPAPFTVTLLPETRFVAGNPAHFAAIKPGNYAGAAVGEGRNGTLKAQEVYLYADALRGTGEGRFTDKDRLLVNGAVTKVDAAPQDGGALTLHYRGAMLSPAGRGKTVCEGRATPAPFASALACSADAVVDVPPGTPVTVLTVGDRNLLVPGVLMTVSVTQLAGRAVSPGLVIESEPPKPVPMEKPQTTP